MGRVSGTCRRGLAMERISKPDESASPSRSLMWTRPTTSSSEPSHSGNRVCPVSFATSTHFRSPQVTSSNTTSRRGAIT